MPTPPPHVQLFSICRVWIVLGALALVGATGCLIEPLRADCGPDGGVTCEQCIARSGCGFCAAAGACVRGTSLGPTDINACGTNDWHFSSCTELSLHQCGRHTGCSGCIYDTECSWCASAGGCISRSATGCAQLITDSSNCSEAECRAVHSCTACAGQHGCTWCDVNGGICTASSSCPSEHWVILNRDCPAPNRCSDHDGSCTACAGTAGCRYCVFTSSNYYCVPTTGPQDYCPSPYTDPTSCP